MLTSNWRATLFVMALVVLVFAGCAGGPGLRPTGVEVDVEVTDADTSAAIAEAAVIVESSRGYTGPDGRETLTAVPEGPRVLEVKKSGYRNDEQNITVAEGMDLIQVELEKEPESETTAAAVELLDEFQAAHTVLEGMFMSHGYSLMEYFQPYKEDNSDELTLMGEYLQELIERGLMPLGMAVDSMTELANDELGPENGDVPQAGLFRITGTPYDGNVEIHTVERWDNEEDFWDWYLFVEEFGIWVTITFEGDEHFTDELPEIFSLNYDDIFSIEFQLNEGVWEDHQDGELPGRQLGQGSVDLEADEAREEFNLYVHGLLLEHIGAWQTQLRADFNLLVEEQRLIFTLDPALLDGPALAGSGAITFIGESEQWAEENNDNGSSSRDFPERIILDLDGSWTLFAQDSGGFTTDELMTLEGTLELDFHTRDDEDDWPFTGTLDITGMYGFSQDGDNHAELNGSFSMELHDVENASQGDSGSDDGVEVSASLMGAISGFFDDRPIDFTIDMEVPQTDFEAVTMLVNSYSYRQGRNVEGDVALDFSDDDSAGMVIDLQLYVYGDLALQMYVNAYEGGAEGTLKDESDIVIAELDSDAGGWLFLDEENYLYAWWDLF